MIRSTPVQLILHPCIATVTFVLQRNEWTGPFTSPAATLLVQTARSPLQRLALRPFVEWSYITKNKDVTQVGKSTLKSLHTPSFFSCASQLVIQMCTTHTVGTHIRKVSLHKVQQTLEGRGLVWIWIARMRLENFTCIAWQRKNWSCRFVYS